MDRKALALVIAVLTLSIGTVVAKLSFPRAQPPGPPEAVPAPDAVPDVEVGGYKLSGPYTHENLTIFLIHGPDQSNGKVFMPLQEAMERKAVIVHETSDVNELAIENVSQTDEVFVQAGDIVKGGQQDRVLAVDLLLPPRSGRVPIAAFCVEQGRWQQRGEERVAQFNSSRDMAATRSLKMAAKGAGSQSGVWREVGEAQAKLSDSVNDDVRSAVSRSSLPLALENEKVQLSTAAYLTKLSPIIESKRDVIGYVFAINHKVNSADLYSSNELFKRLWPKLLKTTAIEAVAERTSSQNGETISAEAMKDFFAGAERGEESTSKVTNRYQMIKRESEKGLFFETRDLSQKGVWLHRSYLAK